MRQRSPGSVEPAPLADAVFLADCDMSVASANDLVDQRGGVLGFSCGFSRLTVVILVRLRCQHYVEDIADRSHVRDDPLDVRVTEPQYDQ